MDRFGCSFYHTLIVGNNYTLPATSIHRLLEKKTRLIINQFIFETFFKMIKLLCLKKAEDYECSKNILFFKYC